MKNQLMRFVTVSLKSKFFKAATVVALIAGTTSAVSAQAVPASNVIASNEPSLTGAVVSHIGTTSDMMVFSVRVPNAAGERFYVQIKDIEGNTIFNSSFSDKNFSKKFQLPKSDSDKYTFIIKDGSGNVAQTFEADSHIRFVEEVVVKKVI